MKKIYDKIISEGIDYAEKKGSDWVVYTRANEYNINNDFLKKYNIVCDYNESSKCLSWRLTKNKKYDNVKI